MKTKMLLVYCYMVLIIVSIVTIVQYCLIGTERHVVMYEPIPVPKSSRVQAFTVGSEYAKKFRSVWTENKPFKITAKHYFVSKGQRVPIQTVTTTYYPDHRIGYINYNDEQSVYYEENNDFARVRDFSTGEVIDDTMSSYMVNRALTLPDDIERVNHIVDDLSNRIVATTDVHVTYDFVKRSETLWFEPLLSDIDVQHVIMNLNYQKHTCSAHAYYPENCYEIDEEVYDYVIEPAENFHLLTTSVEEL